MQVTFNAQERTLCEIVALARSRGGRLYELFAQLGHSVDTSSLPVPIPAPNLGVEMDVVSPWEPETVRLGVNTGVGTMAAGDSEIKAIPAVTADDLRREELGLGDVGRLLSDLTWIYHRLRKRLRGLQVQVEV